MKHSRRDFVKRAAIAGGAISLGAAPITGSEPTARGSTPHGLHPTGNLPADALNSPHPLDILILGGTSFLGPHLIAYAEDRGHSITIFTRGRTEPTLYKQRYNHVEHLIGDRGENLDALKGRTWDAVIDNSGHNADWTRDSAQLLKDAAGMYLYTSSTGVYYPYLGSGVTEETAVVADPAPGIPDNEDSGYGIMKVRSENQARLAFGTDRTIVVRPTYIIGPGDQSNRFPYWPVRLERGGEVFVPGKPDDPVQFIDVRDLTEWMIRLLEQERSGTFNVVGPASPMGMHEFVYGIRSTSSAPVEWVMISDYEFLVAQRVPYVVPWIMPVDDNFGSARISNEKAMANGLTLRPLAVSSLDVVEWWHSDAVLAERRTRLVENAQSLMAREPSIIAAWKSR